MGHWTQLTLSKQFYEETVKLKRIVQIGNQGNSSPAWRKVKELVQQGAIGRVQLVNAGFFRYGDWGDLVIGAGSVVVARWRSRPICSRQSF
jgi:predicted dehydrogenase